jgi:hypothetical protein
MLQTLFSIMNSVDQNLRHLRLSKVQRSRACVVEEAVHGDESASRRYRSREGPICWKAIIQAPGKKDRPADRMKVRQTTGV